MKKIVTLIICAGAALILTPAFGQETTEFGAVYDDMTADQKRLIADWVERFNEVTGQDVEAGPFYDRFVRLSTKTTFDAVTHALTNTPLTDASGASLGTAIGLLERLEDVRGKVKGASGDRQFRIYVVLKEGAVDILNESAEFKRGADNTVFHKGYPMNYRAQGGVPSIQISIALDERRADVDVDYRSSSFPQALFNGHLSAANSDVRAGNNVVRHNGRWEGFTDWWHGLFGLRLASDYEDIVIDDSLQFPDAPRAGKQTIEKMTRDFLDAWLVDGNIIEAMGYVSERAYACLELTQEGPADRGMAPFQLVMAMKEVKDALGAVDDLERRTLGVRLTDPTLKVVRQPHHAQFVLYSVPDDVAQSFECANRQTLSGRAVSRFHRQYGNYFAAVLYVDGGASKGETLALLWAKEGDYWKIVSFESEPEKDVTELSEAPLVTLSRIDEDESFSAAVGDFLSRWLVDRDAASAFSYLSTECYSCYNTLRAEGLTAATSDEQAGRLIREQMALVSDAVGAPASLEDVVEGVEPSHPMIRVMTHDDESAYTLTSVPNVIRQLANCSYRASGGSIPDTMPADYGDVAATLFRFRTVSGETPVYRLVWARLGGEWKITAYDIEDP